MKQSEGNRRSGHRDAKARRVPLIVPHGAAGAGRDFERAFDVLRCDGVHELWRDQRGQQRQARTS